MKYILLIALCWPFVTVAQLNFEIENLTLSDNVKMKSFGSRQEFIDLIDNHAYYYNTDGKNITFFKYDITSMQLLDEKTLKEKDRISFDEEHVALVGSIIYLVTQHHEGKTLKRELKKLSPKDFSVLETKSLESIKQSDKKISAALDFGNKIIGNDAHYTFLYNHTIPVKGVSHYAFTNSNDLSSREEYDNVPSIKYQITEILQDDIKEYEVTIPSKKTLVANINVLNDKIYFLCYSYSFENPNDSHRKFEEKEYFLFIYDTKSKEEKTIEVFGDFDFVANPTLKKFGSDKMLVLGYTLDSDFRINGFTYDLIQNSVIKNTDYHEYSQKFLNEYNEGKTFTGLRVSYLTMFDDGSALVLSEEITFIRIDERLGRHASDELHTTKIKPNGEVAWRKVIPKTHFSFEYTGQPFYISFFPFVKDNVVYCIFNENISVFENKTGYLLNKNEYGLKIKSIDQSGTIKEEFSEKGFYEDMKKYYFHPKDFVQTNDKTMIIRSIRNKKLINGVVQF